MHSHQRIIAVIKFKSIRCKGIAGRLRPRHSTIPSGTEPRTLFLCRRLTRAKTKPSRPHVVVSDSLFDRAPNRHLTKAMWHGTRDFPSLQRLERDARGFGSLRLRKAMPGAPRFKCRAEFLSGICARKWSRATPQRECRSSHRWLHPASAIQRRSPNLRD